MASMTVMSLPQAVEQFVSATNDHDADALLAVFAPEAVVVDDGATFATEDELSGFIRNQIVAPKIVLTPISYDGDRLVASGDGDFPGGPLTFAFTFATKDNLITHLSIEPV
jgi:ketosteroid isomerase-like protein